MMSVMSASYERSVREAGEVGMKLIMLHCDIVNDNDNDKRLGLTAKADQPDKKIQYTKNKNGQLEGHL